MTSTGPVHGMRDFLPVEVRRRTFLSDRFRAVYERYGYDPIDSPALERLDVLLGSGGEDNEKLVYKVLKRGEALERALAAGAEGLAEEGLRFDLTVPLARYYAEHRAKLPRVFRRYHMGPVWRAERPARGRYREFWQCDVDIVGAPAPLGELDVVLATTDALHAVGFDGFTVRLNHRRLLAALLGALGVPEQAHGTAVVAIDKLDKLGTEGVARELAQRGLDAAVVARFERLDLSPLRTVEAREAIERLGGVLSDVAGDRHDAFDRAEAERCIGELRQLAGALATVRGERIRLALDPVLARGMGYYTGPIFEIAVEGLPFSLGGGGRYDGLVGRFLSQPVPAVGFSIGFERVLVLMAERAMFPATLGALDAYVTVFAPEQLTESLLLADSLRAAGLRVLVPVERGSLKAQLKEANERGASAVLIEGPQEREAGAVQVKDMASGRAEIVPRADLVAHVLARAEAARAKPIGVGGAEPA